MMIECLLFRYLAANDYRQHEMQWLRFDLTNSALRCSAHLVQIYEVLSSAHDRASLIEKGVAGSWILSEWSRGQTSK
jgi:hypothetical protein